ncbi:hypothetical protein ACFSKM_13885 [Ancylobacter dichloromethanicus]
MPVRLERLSIPEIVLEEPVLDHAARLSLNGSADIASLAQGLSATFALERLDAPGTLTGSAGYAPDTGRLDLDIAAREPAGGLMARAAGFDGLPEIAASLRGAGPLDAWDGHLRVTVGDQAEASGAAGIRAVANGHKLNFAIDADIANILPANISPLFEGRSEIAGSATVDDAQNLAIENFTAHAAGFQAALNGTLDADQTADLTFDATLGEAARFAALAPGVGWDRLGLAGTLKGPLPAPTVDARDHRHATDGTRLQRRHARRHAAHPPRPLRRPRLLHRRNGGRSGRHRSAGGGRPRHTGPLFPPPERFRRTVPPCWRLPPPNWPPCRPVSPAMWTGAPSMAISRSPA